MTLEEMSASLSNTLITDKYLITVLFKVTDNNTFKRICRHHVVLNNKSTYYTAKNAAYRQNGLLSAVDDCVSDASGNWPSLWGIPLRETVYSTYGTICWECLCHLPELTSFRTLFLLVNSFQPLAANLFLFILTVFHLYRFMMQW